jgi:hypothetical protein
MTGKGFAVVAGEAEEPARATEPAAQQVRAIQDDADEVVLALGSRPAELGTANAGVAGLVSRSGALLGAPAQRVTSRGLSSRSHGQRGGPRIVLPYFAATAGCGVTAKSGGRGVDLSRPVSRNIPSMPAGVVMISRSAFSDVMR